jgi:hypothetical protein
LKFAPAHELVLWQVEHWPAKWLAGLSLEWQEAQSLAPAAWWLKVAPAHELVLWQAEHCPEKWLAGLSLV